jgi:esterase/lipase superfamily enzyme
MRATIPEDVMTFPLPTRRHVLSRLALMASVAPLLGGCLPEMLAPGAVATNSVAPPPGYHPSLLVLTNRAMEKGALKSPYYGHQRARLTAASVLMRRPDSSLTGRATLNNSWSIDKVVPLTKSVDAAVNEVAGGREVLLYIHGYKESFESAVTSNIELADGIGFLGVPILFSWPSKAALFDYGYDRESALYSRDALENVLVQLLADDGAAKVHIVAHSMGTWLTIETLRQMWARHGDTLANRLGAVVLASADIDIDLFRSTAERLRSLVPKITVISSTSDKALEVSRRLAGGVARTGAASREELENIGVRVVDASDHGGWAVIKHDLFLSDPEVRQVVRRAVERGRA